MHSTRRPVQPVGPDGLALMGLTAGVGLLMGPLAAPTEVQATGRSLDSGIPSLVGTDNLALQHGQMISAMLHPRAVQWVRDRTAILHPLVRRKQGKTWNGQLGAATLAGRSPLDLRAEPSVSTEPTAEGFLTTSESSIWSACARVPAADLVVPFDRDGNAIGPTKPADSSKRMVNVGLGDSLVHRGEMYWVLSVEAYRSAAVHPRQPHSSWCPEPNYRRAESWGRNRKGRWRRRSKRPRHLRYQLHRRPTAAINEQARAASVNDCFGGNHLQGLYRQCPAKRLNRSCG
jgi:hypothetical protein